MPTSRICFVVEIFHPEDRGGQGRQSYDLARSLLAAGHSVRAVTRRHWTESKPHEILDGIAVRRLPPCGVHKGRGWRSLAPISRFLIALFVELLRTLRHYDVLVVSGVKMILLPPLLIGLLFGKRVFVRVDATGEIEHAITPESLGRMGLSSSSWLVRSWAWLRRRLLLRADGLIALSGNVREALQRQEIPGARIFDIPNGVDLTLYCPVSRSQQAALRERMALPTGTLFIYAGRLSRAKGLLLLVNTWRHIVANHPGAHLLLVGAGGGSFDDCEAELRALCAAPELTGRVTFTGQVGNVHEYLQASDVFIQCSESEGFGLALVEAMACGLPCISTPVGIAAEVIVPGHSGFLTEVGDRKGLEMALTTMLATRASWVKLGAAAHAAVASRYGWENVVSLYGSLVNAPDAMPLPASNVREAEPASLPVQQ